MSTRVLGLTLAAALSLVATACVPPTPPPPPPCTCTAEALEQGEVDAPTVELVDGELELAVVVPEGDHDHEGEHGDEGDHDHEGEHGEELDPECAVLVATAAAENPVPSDPAYSFLGAAGAPVWVLPQSENADLLYLGYSTEEIPAGAFENDELTFSMVEVDGPGELIVYSVDDLGVPSVLFNSGATLPQAAQVAVGEHVHVNWAFTEPGDYSVSWQFAGTQVDGEYESSGLVEFNYRVEG
jgi:surface-anchored protein